MSTKTFVSQEGAIVEAHVLLNLIELQGLHHRAAVWVFDDRLLGIQ